MNSTKGKEKIFYRGAWRTPEAIARKKAQEAEYEKLRDADPVKKKESLSPQGDVIKSTKPSELPLNAHGGQDLIPRSVESTMRKDLNEERGITMDTGNSGGPGTYETKSDIIGKSATAETVETQLALLTGQNENLDKARLLSMNMLDVAGLRLIECMNSASRNLGDRADFRNVNAIANIGKQIASIAKVKLDAIKEARKS